VSVIVCTRNRALQLEHTLRTLAAGAVYRVLDTTVRTQ
jgi:hypothetical protein